MFASETEVRRALGDLLHYIILRVRVILRVIIRVVNSKLGVRGQGEPW